MRAAAVSFPDVLESRGRYQYKPDLPWQNFRIAAEACPVAGSSHTATTSLVARLIIFIQPLGIVSSFDGRLSWLELDAGLQMTWTGD